MSPSSLASFTPLTVTVWAVRALAGVKVRLFGETVPSVVSLLERATVTVAVGTVLRATVKVAVPPASVVVRPEVGVTVKPCGFSPSSTVPSQLLSRPSRISTVAPAKGSQVLPPHSPAVHVSMPALPAQTPTPQVVGRVSASSTVPSQLSSTLLQISVAPGWTAAFVSSQSVALAT